MQKINQIEQYNTDINVLRRDLKINLWLMIAYQLMTCGAAISMGLTLIFDFFTRVPDIPILVSFLLSLGTLAISGALWADVRDIRLKKQRILTTKQKQLFKLEALENVFSS